jgi:hypothetical protein
MAGKKIMTQMPFVQCPVCGGGMVEKDVEKLLCGGSQQSSALEPFRVALCKDRR